MSEKLFEKDYDENVCSFDYSTLDTHYEYKPSKIIEWNKHSDNAEYTDLERITEILNIKQMRLESLMKHREEIGKLLDRIDEQQSTIEQLQEENKELKHWKKRIIEYLSDWFNKTEYLSVLYKINEIRSEIGLDSDE